MSDDLVNLIENFNTLSKLSNSGELELEIIIQSLRGGISSEQYTHAINVLSKDAEAEPTQYMVDKIHSNLSESSVKHSSSRLTMHYKKKPDTGGYSLIKTVRMAKKRFPPAEEPGYKVVLSTEEIFTVDTTKTSALANSTDFCRIKVRRTFKWTKIPGFKIDLTAVFSTKWISNVAQMNTLCRNIFDADENLNKFNSFELEAEYVNEPFKKALAESSNEKVKVSAESVQNVATALQDLIANKEEDGSLYKEMAEIADIIGRNKYPKMTIKKVMNNPLELNRASWQDIFPPLGWFLTDKADGKRSLIFIRGNRASFISDTVVVKELAESQSKTIVDTEFVGDTYYLFDVLFFKDTSFVKMPFQRRIDEIENAAKYIAELTGAKVLAKPFVRLPVIVSTDIESELKKPIDAMFNRKRPYEIDGLIFNSPDAGYFDTKMLKWKPENTIDFLAVKCPDNMLGRAPYLKAEGKTLYLLFVTIHIQDFQFLGIHLIDGYQSIFPKYYGKFGPVASAAGVFPIQFSPASYQKAYLFYTTETADLNMKIVELSVGPNPKDPKVVNALAKGESVPWILVKIRDDRETDVAAGGYFGNAYYVSESVWQNVINPLTLQDLSNPVNVYFEQDKDPVYMAPMAFNSFIKAQLFKALKPELIYKQYESKEGVSLLDIAAGRGADLTRYAAAEFTHVIAIDNDATALSELSRRRFAIAKTKKLPLIHTAQVNMNDNFQRIIDHFAALGFPAAFDAVSCNFAIHYMALPNLAKFVGKLLKPLGRFGFTVLNGEKVNALLAGIGKDESWKRELPNGFMKYQIKKMYVGDMLNNGGQIIAVKVPFSDTLYTEALVNIDYFLKLLEAEGMQLKTRKPFYDFRSEFATENPDKERKLSADDEAYNGLYEFVIVEKVIKSKVKSAADIMKSFGTDISSSSSAVPTKRTISRKK